MDFNWKAFVSFRPVANVQLYGELLSFSRIHRCRRCHLIQCFFASCCRRRAVVFSFFFFGSCSLFLFLNWTFFHSQRRVFASTWMQSNGTHHRHAAKAIINFVHFLYLLRSDEENLCTRALCISPVWFDCEEHETLSHDIGAQQRLLLVSSLQIKSPFSFIRPRNW